jgi:hypothetical protein
VPLNGYFGMYKICAANSGKVDSIQVYSMFNDTGWHIVTVTTVWWWQKLGRDWQ